MLPQIVHASKKTNNVIYINPHFRNSSNTNNSEAHLAPHINPLFLERHQKIQISNGAPRIYMNPVFLTKQIEQNYMERCNQPPPLTAPAKPLGPSPSIDAKSTNNQTTPLDVGRIICKSRTHIVREPQTDKNEKSTIKPLIILSKRKIIRNIPASRTAHISSNKFTTYLAKGQYNLDKRQLIKSSNSYNIPRAKIRSRESFVRRYALKRASTNLTISKQRKWDYSVNKKLCFLKINGVLYKSTSNSLKLKEPTKLPNKTLKITAKKHNNSIRSQKLAIFIRGTKYVMDPQKYKLTRVADSSDINEPIGKNKTTSDIPRRIDIGGVTYISGPSSRNVYKLSANHLTRAFINNAKQKSLQMLSKRLVKCNVPCPIYQYVGKCAAFERGKCSKVHDKLQVKVCSRFLRGECLNAKCLLSHNVCFSKMPVCKFFLLGLCGRDDCPYLHKKLSNNAEVCVNFIRGFCHLADKCDKRHEFVCPEYERTGECHSNGCIYCKRNKKKFSENAIDENVEFTQTQLIPKQSTSDDLTEAKEDEEIAEQKRYFTECKMSHDTTQDDADTTRLDDNNDLDVDVNGKRLRKKLGSLPAYIPLS